MLDMHQDLFSEKFCGDGIPMWLIPEEESTHFPTPIPKKINFDNETGYLMIAASKLVGVLIMLLGML